MFAVMAATAVAQTQQGYVKTRGKLAADGKSVIPGVRLSNALVTIENRSPVKSGTDGAFSFTLPTGTNRYRLLSAELKGYTLADPDAVRQMHTYSKDLPFIVVLEDMKQREADLEAARKSVRNVMKREIRKKQDELDSLRDAHAITQAKYDSLVRDFWEYRQSSEKLVNEMAERYVSTDYDQLDDFNQQVQAYIESGQLTKADSMIRSKGSLKERFNRVKQYEATNAQREVEIQQQQEALDKSRQYTQKEKEDLANDLYRQHLIFLQQPMMQDSALYYLKLRADLDTTNLDAVWGYAYLSHNQKAFYEAEKYYKLALGNYEKLFAANPDAYRAALAGTQNNLGYLYSDLHDYASSERYYKLALENREKLFAANPAAYRADLASTQNNLGILYYGLQDYACSERYYKLALENYEKLFAANPAAYRAALAMTQNNLGNLYSDLQDYASSERYYKLALENKEKLFAANPAAYRAALASTQDNLGILYRALHDYASSERYYKLALENREKLFAANPAAYRAALANTHWNMMLLYAETEQIDQYDTSLKKTLDLSRNLYSLDPPTYKQDIIDLQNRTVLRMLVKGGVDEALALAKENYALDETNKTSLYYLAQCFNSKAYLYANAADYTQAMSTIDKAIELMPREADFYDSKGEILLMQGKDQEALKIWQKVLELNPKFLDGYPEGTNLSNGLKAKGLIK